MSEKDSETFVVRAPRRAPKYSRFIVGGMLLGFIVAVALFYLGPAPSQYSGKDVLLVLALYCIPTGGFLGAVLALIIDRRSLKKSASID